MPGSHAISARRPQRVRQAGHRPDARDESVSGSSSARDSGEGGTRIAIARRGPVDPGDRVPSVGAAKRARCPAARCHDQPPSDHDALSLVLERAREGIFDRAVSAGLRPGWLLCRGLRPGIGALRTFAVERIQSLSLTEERFDPMDLPADAFENSLGVNQGTPERIEIVFEPRIARHLKERVWHPSQQIEERRTAG